MDNTSRSCQVVGDGSAFQSLDSIPVKVMPTHAEVHQTIGHYLGSKYITLYCMCDIDFDTLMCSQ